MSIESDLLRALRERSVRFVAIGVWGVNQYARDIRELFATEDKGAAPLVFLDDRAAVAGHPLSP